MTSAGTDSEPDDLDGCDLPFGTVDRTHDEDVDALVMYADCWDDPDAVERRRVELVEWGAALQGDP